jgi:hypothetical protein
VTRRHACAVLAAAAVLAGCGGATKTKTVERTVTQTASTATTAATGGATTPAAKTPSPPPAPARPAKPALHLTTFRSPSANIGCAAFAGSVRCDIRDRDWSPPPRPARCPDEVDFGQGIEIGPTGSPHFVCAGDTALNPTATPLPYGRADSAGQVRCTSATAGITCRNPGGRGFFLSRQRYRLL